MRIETYGIQIGDRTYQVDAHVTGWFEARTDHSPGSTPEVEIVAVAPARDDDFDAAAAREEITNRLREEMRSGDVCPPREAKAIHLERWRRDL